ncbi:helix-turn-helix domain-containing protein [Methylocystis parvus]|uniref:Helix-turn-helix transcriptional regulator n=1 Tax=Methylocystis parvus TaxID=134 RepID=A0A6B8M5R8_9HYPH|nr:helix-turn-helix domain-containing protein [Methylocystis parvus]QGM97695.1 helix-turn-helix transcriptional regulator [Methylocystis parvus]WBJ98370.1 helix-turn-helix domain-containing protein [Methylocystis parvus OBBP]
MLTDIGKELRKLRIDEGERLADMARRIGKSASFISAVEVGKKAPPAGFEDLVAKSYQLADGAWQALRRAADASRTAFVIQPNSALARDTAGLMARKIDGLSDEELLRIRKILEGSSK